MGQVPATTIPAPEILELAAQLAALPAEAVAALQLLLGKREANGQATSPNITVWSEVVSKPQPAIRPGLPLCPPSEVYGQVAPATPQMCRTGNRPNP